MNKQPDRALIFIDGSNFYYKLKEIVFSTTDDLRLMNFDYQKFFKDLIKENTLAGARYYIGSVKRQDGENKEKSEKLYADQQKFIARLNQQGIVVVLGNLIQHPDKTFHEKGVDVRIAVEMIRLARQNDYDVAFLLSSDTDLVPAVEEVHVLGKKVYYVGFLNGQSFGLTKLADYTILIRSEEIISCLPKVL